MSGLAALLAGRLPVDVYRWETAFEPADVRHTVEHAEWRFGYVDGWRCQSKVEVLDAFARTLDLPETFGRNLDALADSLADVGAGGIRTGDKDQVGTVLLWDGWGTLARADERAFTVMLSILGERVRADRGAPFAVLLRGEGPDPVGIPALE